MEAPGRIQMAIDHWLLEQQAGSASVNSAVLLVATGSLGYHQSNWPEYWQQLTKRTLQLTTSYGWTGSAAPRGLTYAVVTSGLCGSRVQVYQALCEF